MAKMGGMVGGKIGKMKGKDMVASPAKKPCK